MNGSSPRIPGPDRCACCGGPAFFTCEACEMPLCPLHKTCPECDSEEDVLPLPPLARWAEFATRPRSG
jgi:hypothetical protein